MALPIFVVARDRLKMHVLYTKGHEGRKRQLNPQRMFNG
jgi:hypothetical protein